mmetsp:Transcript_33546/g.88106  ORF Transcript_33546/g.88106 Transcript_33546/m.88106 type:complete len:309 (+) Transcript_33546:380-1306(+)
MRTLAPGKSIESSATVEQKSVWHVLSVLNVEMIRFFSSPGVLPYSIGLPSISENVVSASTRSQNTIILSPRRSCSRIRYSSAWNLFGFMTPNSRRSDAKPFLGMPRSSCSLMYSAKKALVIFTRTSWQLTSAMKPSRCKSSQLASNNLGPNMNHRSLIFPSSRSSVAVRPSLQLHGFLRISRKVRAGAVCTSSRIIRPHLLDRMKSRSCWVSGDRGPECPIIEYVHTMTPLAFGLSLSVEQNRVTTVGFTDVHRSNSDTHCSTATSRLHSTNVRFRIVHAAAMPVKVLPAPQGSTITPDRARPRPKNF